MIKYFILILCLTTLTHAQDTEEEVLEVPDPAMTTPVVTTTESKNPLDDDKDFKARKGHLVTTFGAEGMTYEVPFEFDGVRKDFKPGDQELYGGRVGVGMEIYIGGGLNTTTKVEGYYVGTLFNSRKSADPEVENIEFAFTKTTGHVYGLEAAQSLGYLIDFPTKTLFGVRTVLVMEPFLEAGLGAAKAYNRVNYNYNTGPSPGVVEEYKMRVTDDLLSVRLSVGLNVISSEGYFLHMKLSQTHYNVTDREFEEEITRNQTGTIVERSGELDADLDPTYAFILGGGYKF